MPRRLRESLTPEERMQGIKCNICGHEPRSVFSFNKLLARVRKYKCPKCGHSFHTEEKTLSDKVI